MDSAMDVQVTTDTMARMLTVGLPTDAPATAKEVVQHLGSVHDASRIRDRICYSNLMMCDEAVSLNVRLSGPIQGGEDIELRDEVIRFYQKRVDSKTQELARV